MLILTIGAKCIGQNNNKKLNEIKKIKKIKKKRKLHLRLGTGA